jgi:hypothetical protein
VDTLELVDRRLGSLVGKHRHRLPAYALQLTCLPEEDRDTPPLFLVELRGGSGLEQQPLLALDDLLHWVLLDTRQVAAIERLRFLNEHPAEGMEAMVGAVEILRAESKIPIEVVEIDYQDYQETLDTKLTPMADFAARLGARGVEITGYGSFCDASAGHWEGIQSIVCHSRQRTIAASISNVNYLLRASFSGRVVHVTEGEDTDYLMDVGRVQARQFLRVLIDAVCRRVDSIKSANVLMVICDYSPPGWPPLMEDAEPQEVERMDEWWRTEMSAADSRVQGYYRLLEGCEWMVWRVGSADGGGRHLRVMQRVGGGSARVSLALHFAVVDDADAVGVAEGMAG